jgi:uncharacterized protein (TIGR02145 family)
MKNPFLKKAILFSFCLLTSAFLLQAQAPQGIPYQAIARNASGAAIANTAVKVRFSIRDSIATGAIKYQETHSPTTSALGLFSVNVGMGTVVSGTFSGINWGKNAKFLQVELDPAGGTSYTDLGTTQMMSVPYALQANAIKMRTSATGDTLYTGGGNYVIIPGISAANPSTGNPNWNGTTLTDIDGNTYQTVTIGNQIWMKENLKVSKYRNGDNIPTNLNDGQWSSATSGAYSFYNNDAASNSVYGKLYNWYAVADTRKLCPSGWHVPTDHDWNIFIKYLDSSSDSTCDVGVCYNSLIAGGMLKSTSALWYNNTGGTNETGFGALPGGVRIGVSGIYYLLGTHAFLWSSTPKNSSSIWYRVLFGSGAEIARHGDCTLSDGFSVRCLKD